MPMSLQGDRGTLKSLLNLTDGTNKSFWGGGGIARPACKANSLTAICESLSRMSQHLLQTLIYYYYYYYYHYHYNIMDHAP
jgi:hypothetical protein